MFHALFRARVDGLVSCEETPTQLVQVYKGREDRLRYKQVNFAPRTKKFEPAETAYKRQIVVRVCQSSILEGLSCFARILATHWASSRIRPVLAHSVYCTQ